jgi:hypothetical protein
MSKRFIPAVVMGCVFATILPALLRCSPAAAGEGKTESKKAEGKGSDTQFEECRSKLKKLQQLDVLYDLDWKAPHEPRVVVGPTFFNLPIDAKEQFAKTVNCFLMAGDTSDCLNFDVLHWRTGKAVGRFSLCKYKSK